MRLIGDIYEKLTVLTDRVTYALRLAQETGPYHLPDSWIDALQKDLRELIDEAEKTVTMYDIEKLVDDLDRVRDRVELAYESDEEDRLATLVGVANRLLVITASVGLHKEREEAHPVFQAGLMIIEDDNRPLEAIKEDWEALDRLVEPYPGKSILERVRSALEK